MPRRLATSITAALGLIGFGFYERSLLVGTSESRVSFWDLVLSIVGSGYVLTFWITPIAMIAATAVLAGGPRPEELIRRDVRADWATARLKSAAVDVGLLIAIHASVATLISLGLPFSWMWTLENGVLVADRPAVAPILPLPILALAAHLLAIFLTMLALAWVVCLVAGYGNRGRAAAVVASALTVWSMVTFQLDLPVVEYITPANYALPSRGASLFPVAPLAAAYVLLLALVVAWVGIRSREVSRAKRH